MMGRLFRPFGQLVKKHLLPDCEPMADPLASLVLVYYGIKEGIEARRHAAEL